MNSLICCPLTPPWALMSATYISIVFFSGSPRNEAGPVIDSTDPILMSAWAALPARTSAATAPAIVRMEFLPFGLAILPARPADLCLEKNGITLFQFWEERAVRAFRARALRAGGAPRQHVAACAGRVRETPQEGIHPRRPRRRRMRTGPHPEVGMERSFKEEVKALRLGA